MQTSLLGILIAISSIQFGAAVAKKLFDSLSATGVASLRLFFAAFILLLIFRPWRKPLERMQIQVIVLYGACLGVMNLLFYLALARIPLGVAVALEFVGPLGVAIFLSRQKLDFLWGAFAAIGIILLLPIHSFSLSIDLGGVFLALGAGACWGFYILCGARAGQIVRPSVAASLGMFVASLFVIPFGIITEGEKLFNLSFLPTAIAIAILSSALPYTLEMFALKKIPAKTFGILMSLEPALAALFGHLYLKEYLGTIEFTAIFFVICASLGSTLTSRKALKEA